MAPSNTRPPYRSSDRKVSVFPKQGRKAHARRRIYLAGPEVFLADAADLGQSKKDLCAEFGFEGLFPLDNEMKPIVSNDRIDALIYRSNIAMMHDAHIGIFNLTPFRGVSADAGTIFELGLMVGYGKRVFGYTNDPDGLFERYQRADLVAYDPVRKDWRDSARMRVENFGNADNLMIDRSLIDSSGHAIVRHRAASNERFLDLTAFRECLRLAAESISRSATRSRKPA